MNDNILNPDDSKQPKNMMENKRNLHLSDYSNINKE